MSSFHQVKVQAPADSKPGDIIELEAHGKRLQVRIPDGVAPNSYFVVPIPMDASGDVPLAVPLQTADMSRTNLPPANSFGGLNDQMTAFKGELNGQQPAGSYVAQAQMVGETKLVGGPDYVPPISVNVGDGSLVSILSGLQAVRIEQQPHLIEFCDWEARNEYRVYGCDPMNYKTKSAQMLHVTETSDCMERQCCGQFRSCELQIRRGAMKESPVIARFVKDFHLNLCFFFMRPRAVALDHNGTALGSVYDPCAFLTVNPKTYDPNGNESYVISGTICQMAVCLPCADFSFDILDQSGKVCGRLVKVFNGCAELALKVNHFVIVFPPDATPQQKATIFCAAFLIDFQYFEVKNNNDSS